MRCERGCSLRPRYGGRSGCGGNGQSARLWRMLCAHCRTQACAWRCVREKSNAPYRAMANDRRVRGMLRLGVLRVFV